MKHHGFTIWEALLVLVGVCIVSAIVLPSITVNGHDRERARRAACQNNLKRIALGFKQYLQDYEQYPIAKNSPDGLTVSSSWIGQLSPYLKSTPIFQCPSDKNATGPKNFSYGYNARLSKTNEFKIGASVLIVLNYEVTTDSNNHTQTGTSPEAVTAATRHKDGANYSFADGHVKWFKPGKVTARPFTQDQPTFNIR